MYTWRSNSRNFKNIQSDLSQSVMFTFNFLTLSIFICRPDLGLGLDFECLKLRELVSRCIPSHRTKPSIHFNEIAFKPLLTLPYLSWTGCQTCVVVQVATQSLVVAASFAWDTLDSCPFVRQASNVRYPRQPGEYALEMVEGSSHAFVPPEKQNIVKVIKLRQIENTILLT